MSTLQVANVWLESTANNRLQVINGSAFSVYSGGVNTALIQSGYMAITGNTSIGTVAAGNPAYKLYVNGTIYATGDITALSDVAMKTDIMPISGALSIVGSMNGVSYKMIDSGESKIGLIAQEVKKVLPEVVVENGGQIGIAYQNIVAVLIEAVKELKQKVEALEKK